MNDTLLTTLVSSGSALVICVLNNIFQMKLILYRLSQIEKKQDKYNNVIERTFNLEKNQGVMQEQIKVANNRISDLEKGA